MAQILIKIRKPTEIVKKRKREKLEEKINSEKINHNSNKTNSVELKSFYALKGNYKKNLYLK